MPRRLGPDEAALWAKVAASVRPLPGRSAPPAGRPPRAVAPVQPAAAPPPLRARLANTVAVDAATLDGSWDRSIRTGRLSPDMTVDLHGYTRDRAHDVLTQCIRAASANGARVLLVITGRGDRGGGRGPDSGDRPRGVIRASLRDWLQSPELRPYIAALRAAHPRHGGGGAWYVILRRG